MQKYMLNSISSMIRKQRVILTSSAVAVGTVLLLIVFQFLYPPLQQELLLSIDFRASQTGSVSLYYDTGIQFQERESQSIIIRADSTWCTYSFPLPNKKINALRLDPQEGKEAEFQIRDIRIINSQGKTLRRIEPEDVKPLHQIRHFERSDRIIHFQTDEISKDPQLLISPEHPITFSCITFFREHLLWLLIAGLGSFSVCLLIFHIFRTERTKSFQKIAIFFVLTVLYLLVVWFFYVKASTCFLEASIKTTSAETAQLYFDTGQGLSEGQTAALWVNSIDSFGRYRFPLPNETIYSLRLDPPSTIGTVIINNVLVTDGLGRIIRNIPLDQLYPLHQIEKSILRGDHLAVTSIKNATDPQIGIHLQYPLQIPTSLFWGDPLFLTVMLALWAMNLLLFKAFNNISYLAGIVGARLAAFFLNTKWIQQMFFPLVVLTLYFVSFSWFLSWLLPEYGVNVNAAFVNSAWKLSLLLVAGLYLTRIIAGLSKGRHPDKTQHEVSGAYHDNLGPDKLSFENRIKKLCIGDLFLILLPLTPVVQYILNNQEILSSLGQLYVFAVFVIFSVLFIIIIPKLLSIIGSSKTMMIIGLAFTFTITNMAFLSANFHWFERGSLWIQLALFSAIFLVCWILYNLIGRKILYLVVAIFFITNSMVQLASSGGAKIKLSGTANKLVELIGSKKPLSTPNIYLLIYDAYVTNETMLQYGIDNSSQEKYLETLGFRLYPHTYSVGAASIHTMSRVLNASTEYYDSQRKGVSGDGITQNLLKSFGYETYGIFNSDFFFQGIGSSYNFSFPKASFPPYKLLSKAIFMGEFRFDFEFEKTSYEQIMEYKLSVFKDIPKKPRFVYMHFNSPSHSQNSGACLPNEAELFRERLFLANNVMKQDIEVITQKDPHAIIIVAGDHGPYLTKNCTVTNGQYDISEISRLDIQDRFGTFLAIKWPDEDFLKYDDITILQDLFPAIFAYIFKDHTILEAKITAKTFDEDDPVSGASVKNGIIYGGINDGEPLFVDQR